ncbi:hypothetical protein AMAG_19160 [Allomyces macrogynus ATCC 38327]|uniref:Uncharacterized protein n=1 Tax=Allomyces macrogynus (strain ATCC 38327) TaxID=578462 RepID=A0A0L0SPN0_ALLM3|nr:hypothetical protein AMAG_19160 [Allomyces macrogynus ATCC 38327]|eukprot:KNE64452.1 hypothetical protein AMAG_19160 [Allomyces macrogynus ATCC 38327]
MQPKLGHDLSDVDICSLQCSFAHNRCQFPGISEVVKGSFPKLSRKQLFGNDDLCPKCADSFHKVARQFVVIGFVENVFYRVKRKVLDCVWVEPPLLLKHTTHKYQGRVFQRVH